MAPWPVAGNGLRSPRGCTGDRCNDFADETVHIRGGDSRTLQPLHLIEIEENLQREELTAVQRSESQVALGKLIAQRLREEAEIRELEGLQVTDEKHDGAQTPENTGVGEFSSVADNVGSGRARRPVVPDSQDKAAAEMGITQSVLSNAHQRHCQLIDQRSHLMRYSPPTIPPRLTNHTPE